MILNNGAIGQVYFTLALTAAWADVRRKGVAQLQPLPKGLTHAASVVTQKTALENSMHDHTVCFMQWLSPVYALQAMAAAKTATLYGCAVKRRNRRVSL